MDKIDRANAVAEPETIDFSSLLASLDDQKGVVDEMTGDETIGDIDDGSKAEREFVPETPTSPLDISQFPLKDSEDESDKGEDADTAESGSSDLLTVQQDDFSLTLADVLASTYSFFPEINRAQLQGGQAQGALIEASGEFDTKFKAYSLNEPTGFYENYRHGLGLARRTWWGSNISGGYRLGRGSIQPWYKERQTHEGGEFKLSLQSPLMRGRRLDPQRVGVLKARLGVAAVDPNVRIQILGAASNAAKAYWDWVLAGAVFEAQQLLTELAEKRVEVLDTGVKTGKLAEINLILNDSLLASRRQKEILALQKLKVASVKLSLYLRDDAGRPLIPDPQWLPQDLPGVLEPEFESEEVLISEALRRRPEFEFLSIERQQLIWDQQLARNDTLPQLDFIAEASQDMGPPATKTDDKGEFELIIGFTSEVPLQRRKARGKLRQSISKQQQIDQKIRLTQNKIVADIRMAQQVLDTTFQIIEQADISYRVSLDVLRRYRVGFRAGKNDLVLLNLVESTVTENQIELLKAKGRYFQTLAELQIALGTDPLDPAIAMIGAPQPETSEPAGGNRDGAEESEGGGNSDRADDDDSESDSKAEASDGEELPLPVPERE